MARTKKLETSEVQGRALVDIAALGLKSGEYATLPIEVAQMYSAVGMFDMGAKND